MEALGSSIPNIGLGSAEGRSFRDKLNAQWHERALQLFMIIVLAHWGEHLAQAVQIYIMDWPRPEANGILGLWHPWVIQLETLHYAYAIVMLAGIWVLRKGFVGRALKWCRSVSNPILAPHRAFSSDIAGHDSP